MPKRHRHRHASVPPPGAAKPTAVAAPTPPAVLPPQELAALLLDPARVRPVVVISRFPDEDQPHLNAEAITLELKGIADVVTIINGPATYALEGLLPVDTHVFGSAARVYPPGLKWTKEPYSSPLRLVRSVADTGPVTAEIIADAEAVAFSGGWKTASPASVRDAGETGLVKSIAGDGSRAVVELDSGLQAFLPAESTRLEVPLHWMLHEGMTITGAFDTAKRIFSIAAIEPPAAGEGRSDGDVVPALVLSVRADSAELSLVPGHSHTVALSRISSNELDSVDDLLTVGEVVAVRLHRRGGQIGLSMLDVDDSEPVLPAPPLVPGGQPWLMPGRDLVPKAAGAQFAQPKPPASGDGRHGSVSGAPALKSVELTLATERSKRVQLESELERLKFANHEHQAHAAQLDEDVMLGRQQAAELSGVQQELAHVRRDLAAANKQLSDLKKKLRGVRKEEATPERMFLDPAEDFAFQLNQTWAQQIPAADKDRLALGAHRVGEGFLTSLREQPPEKQKKAYRAIVDLLVNDPARLSARDAHHFRSNASGGSPAVTRNGGRDQLWRLSIEQHVAAARRLHYWKCADGVIELSSVTVHDGAQA